VRVQVGSLHAAKAGLFGIPVLPVLIETRSEELIVAAAVAAEADGLIAAPAAAATGGSRIGERDSVGVKDDNVGAIFTNHGQAQRAAACVITATAGGLFIVEGARGRDGSSGGGT
jgi:hypothetical protein